MLIENDGRPVYIQLYTLLKRKIDSGQWKVNSMLPPEASLAKTYGVARETMRRAILMLADEGYLVRKSGVGTLICSNQSKHTGDFLLHFAKDILDKKVGAKMELIGKEYIVARDNICKCFGLEAKSKLLRIKHLYTVNKTAFAVEELYINPTAIDEKDDFNELYRLYGTIKGEVKSFGGRIVQEIKNITADKDIAEDLSIPINSPVTAIDCIIHTRNDQPFARLYFIYRGELYSTKIRLVAR